MQGRFTRRAIRRTAALTGITVLAAVGSGCGSSLSSDSGESGASTLKVGLVVPASGVYEPVGIDMTRGFQLYLDQKDGKLGGHKVDLVKADEGEGPDTGVPATTKLVTQNRVSVLVGIVNSATGLGVKKLVAQSKVPLIVANAGANDLADGSPYVWRTSFTNGDIGSSLGKEVAEQVGDGKAYVIAADYAAGHEYAEGFKKAFAAAGGKLAGESYTPFGTTSDWQPFLTKAKNSGAKAVFAFYAGAEAVGFVKQYKAFGLSGKIPLYAPGFLTEGGVLAAQGADAKGIHTSLHYSNLLDTPANNKFVKAYTAAYKVPPTVYAVQAYDAAAAVDKAAASADDMTGVSIAKALESVDTIDSPRGTWSFDETHSPKQPYFLREVQDVNGTLGNVIVSTLAK